MAKRTEGIKREEMIKNPLFCDSNGRCKYEKDYICTKPADLDEEDIEE